MGICGRVFFFFKSYRVLDALEKSSCIGIETELENFETVTNDFRTDVLIKIRIREVEIKFCVEVKKNVSRTLLGMLLNYRNDIPNGKTRKRNC